MSISIIYDTNKLVNPTSKLRRRIGDDYELQTVAVAVVSAVLGHLGQKPPELSDDFVYHAAKKWLATFKANDVEIEPVPLMGTDFHRGLCLALINLDHRLENIPTFTDTFEEQLESFDEYIVRAYYKLQIKLLLKHSDDDYDICRGENAECYE